MCCCMFLLTIPYGSKYLLRRYFFRPRIVPTQCVFQAPDPWIYREHIFLPHYFYHQNHQNLGMWKPLAHQKRQTICEILDDAPENWPNNSTKIHLLNGRPTRKYGWWKKSQTTAWMYKTTWMYKKYCWCIKPCEKWEELPINWLAEFLNHQQYQFWEFIISCSIPRRRFPACKKRENASL